MPATTVKIEQESLGTRRLRLAGAWRVGDRSVDAQNALATIGDEADIQRVTVIDDGITKWDSSLPVFLRALKAVTGSRGADLDVSGLPDGVQRLLRLAEHTRDQTGARGAASKPSWLARVGAQTVRAARDFGASVVFLGELTIAFGNMLRGRARYRQSDLWAVIQECGPDALPIISLISVLVGMILAFLGAVQLRMFGAEVFIANAVAVGMVREMGALMTGIIMAGRTGASFAARLGTMQVNEEVDALQTMGFSPMEFLVLPRAIALILMMPLLTIYANVLGILGGAIIGIFMLDLTPTQYYVQTVNALSMQAILSGLIKSAVYGILVALSGCMQGMRCGRSAEAVGQATTAAVVNAIVYIIIADSLISIIYVITGF